MSKRDDMQANFWRLEGHVGRWERFNEFFSGKFDDVPANPLLCIVSRSEPVRDVLLEDEYEIVASHSQWATEVNYMPIF